MRAVEDMDIEKAEECIDPVNIRNSDITNAEDLKSNCKNLKTGTQNAFIRNHFHHCISFFAVIALFHSCLLIGILVVKLYEIHAVTLTIVLSSYFFWFDVIMLILNILLLFCLNIRYKKITLSAMVWFILLIITTISHHLFYFPINEQTLKKLVLQDLFFNKMNK